MREVLWVVVLVGLLAWAWLLEELGLADRLARGWVRRARRQGRWAGPLALLGSTVLVVVFVVVVLAVTSPVLDIAAAVVYVPFALATAPDYHLRHTEWRARLVRAGASGELGRTIAWWAGVPSFVGLWVGLVNSMLVVMPG